MRGGLRAAPRHPRNARITAYRSGPTARYQSWQVKRRAELPGRGTFRVAKEDT